MESVTCIDIATFPNALTRGKQYAVLASDAEKHQVKISGDNGRVRWFPSSCFTSVESPLLRVKSVTLDDEIRNPYCDTVEISITVLRGEAEAKRWCYFLTPAYIYKLFDSATSAPQLLGRHAVLVPVLTPEVIHDAVNYLEVHNLLDECTLPLETEGDP
jgi:hypothetical protein